MEKKLFNELNSQQLKAVKKTEGPMLILAGAGSGKTKVLTHRVAYLIQIKKIQPQSILMVTFTNKAAGEMKKRISSLIESESNLPFAGTFHSLCAKILRIDGQEINIPSSFVIYDDADQLDAVKEIMKKLDINSKNVNPGAVLHAISNAKNEMLSPEDYFQYKRGFFMETVSEIYASYQKLLAENKALDFDDLLVKTVRLFEQSPATVNKYQKKIQYILVDEYQDTNKPQYLLSKILAGQNKNITVVGDASQSIYKWRGADFRNISNFKNDYPDLNEFFLEQNYRSTGQILDAANGVIKKNTTHPVLKLWTKKPHGEKITLYEARNEHDEATYIAQAILQSNKKFSDFAVLYRTNAQSRTIEEAFLHAGIPYLLIGGTKFYERREVKDVIAYLRLIINPNDSVSYKRAEKIGKNRLARFLKLSHDVASDNKLLNLTSLEMMDKILKITNYLELYDANIEEEAYRLENIMELRSVASEFPNLNDFLENISLVKQEYYPQELKNKDDQRNAVTLMTMHAAKGLEYDSVFIIGMEEGLFPHSRSLTEKDELEEERRLCYVGITRAKNKLCMTFANKRLFFGTRTQNMVSRFISDIPEHLIDYQISLSMDRGFNRDDYLL